MDSGACGGTRHPPYLRFGFLAVFKATAAYELPLTVLGGASAKDPADNLFTLQLQAKF